MGFYFRVAPGLRLRLTSRGLRASIGPRAARLHVGAGGPGVSTGAGPVSYYHSLSGVNRRARGGARAEKLAQAQQVNAIWEQLLNVHREEFPSTQPPLVPASAVIELQDLVEQRRRESTRGINWFRRRDRAQAREAAKAQAQQEWERAVAAADAERARRQTAADQRWQLLLANDPVVVMETLVEAFEDNDAPATPVAVAGSEVSMAVLAPAQEAIPIRMGRVTEAGNISLAKLAKGERGQLITSITLGYLLVTLREAFACAPGLQAARVVVVRVADVDTYGVPSLECLVAGRWLKERLDDVTWQDVDAGTIAIDTADELMLDMRGGAPRALDLADEPELRELISAIDIADLDEPSAESPSRADQ
jgi:hypothetical protein